MTKRKVSTYTPDEELDDIVAAAEVDAAEERRMQRRIRREVVRIADDDEVDAESAEELDVEEGEGATNSRDEASGEATKQEPRRRKSLWGLITTGSFLTSSSARQYYRYLAAIAIMCFVSIFLKFMALNADIESRRLEKEATILRERAILFKEQRHNASTKSEIERHLSESGIELINLSGKSRIIER